MIKMLSANGTEIHVFDESLVERYKGVGFKLAPKPPAKEKKPVRKAQKKES